VLRLLFCPTRVLQKMKVTRGMLVSNFVLNVSLYNVDRICRSRSDDNVYTRPSAGSLPTRLASRLSLVVCGSNICDGRHYAYAECLGSSSVHETSVISAVLLEQAASHYFQASMFRKYAFHLIMAGHIYRSTNKQEKHAAR